MSELTETQDFFLRRTEPIRAVWEQYKHLDILLSDPAWMLEEGHPMAPQRKCLSDCWLAIKKFVIE